jgi:predicted small metal-binding protein
LGASLPVNAPWFQPCDDALFYTEDALVAAMANMATCACGWTIISPQGAEDVKKHVLIHVGDAHPGTKVSEGEIHAMIKSV